MHRKFLQSQDAVVVYLLTSEQNLALKIFRLFIPLTLTSWNKDRAVSDGTKYSKSSSFLKYSAAIFIQRTHKSPTQIFPGTKPSVQSKFSKTFWILKNSRFEAILTWSWKISACSAKIKFSESLTASTAGRTIPKIKDLNKKIHISHYILLYKSDPKKTSVTVSSIIPDFNSSNSVNLSIFPIFERWLTMADVWLYFISSILISGRYPWRVAEWDLFYEPWGCRGQG